MKEKKEKKRQKQFDGIWNLIFTYLQVFYIFGTLNVSEK